MPPACDGGRQMHETLDRAPGGNVAKRSGCLAMIPASIPADRPVPQRRTRAQPITSIATRDMRASISNVIFRSSLYHRMVLNGPVPSEIRQVFPSHAPGDRTQAETILGQEV